MRRGVILGAAGGRYRVYLDGEEIRATLRGRMKQGDERVLVGDRVAVAIQADGSATIEDVEERRSVFQRRRPGGGHGVRAVVANVDQVVAVGAARQPDWDPPLMDRFVAVAEANQVAVTIVVNKCDLEPHPERLAGPYQGAGYRVLFTSVPQRCGLDDLRAVLRGRVSVFAGPTGVGKSSLLNAIQPGLRLRTRDVGRRGGRHTTVAADMHPLAEGGFVVDTPGLRDVGLWGLEPLEVARAFPEFARHARECRFDNCRHLEEPDCAVARAVERGEIAASRLDSYRKLLGEALAAARPWA